MTQRQPWEKPPLVYSPQLKALYDLGEYISGKNAQQARSLYERGSRNFDPWRDLSTFGQHVFFGDYDEVVKEYELTKPDVAGSETAYRWGYICLAGFGSRTFANTIPGKYPHVDIIRFLHEHGAPVNLSDIAGLTALHHVAVCNRVGEVMKTLIELGADTNHQDRYGTLPIHGAIQNCQAEAVELCLKHGADIETLDSDGVAPLDLIRFSSPAVNAVLDRYLREKDGKAVAVDQKGRCASCGKNGCKNQCARCRVVRYCDSYCQAAHWKRGHRSSCIPFGDTSVTLTCKPTYGGCVNGLNVDVYTRRLVGQPDGEGKQREVQRNWERGKGRRRVIKPPKKEEKREENMQLAKSVPDGFVGKTITVKATIPDAIRAPALTEQQLASIATFGLDPRLIELVMGGDLGPVGKNEVVIHDKSRRFSCRILPEGQPEEHARLEGVIREKGLMGMKAYFMAELESEYSLKIRIGDMLAVQAW